MGTWKAVRILSGSSGNGFPQPADFVLRILRIHLHVLILLSLTVGLHCIFCDFYGMRFTTLVASIL